MKTPTYLYPKVKSLLALLPALALLPGCETVVDLPEPPHTPRIALQYTLSNTPPPPANPNPNGSSYYYDITTSRQLFVSNSQRIFDTKYLEGRDDATVEIRNEQGAVVERFKPADRNQVQSYGPGSYVPTMGLLGQPGKTYTLRAALPGFETVESTLTMPAAPVIESATFAPRTSGSGQSNQTRGRLLVTLTDNPATTDYYLAFARVLDKQGRPGNWSPVQLDYESETSDFEVGTFQLSNTGSYRGYEIYPYADTNVNGQRFSLNSNVSFYAQSYCPPNQSNCPEVGYLEVFISAITADAYNFYQSQRRYNDADGNPFAEPAPLSSNIKPGYGLFGGATDATYRIKLF
ncbi:protein of unknown function [Hymenobacter daecheongensis DSM 21074]|uniref:DUF4249 domain-containing protein n=1 Tax=Hymenobacter daecheongensis DSM 21074 TaxID=1121955 RepID=A0A1M6GTU1_9BACT|nr:DUF4249 domain-containing protein [Hymenobacter daecheongensis]SHJ13322.1 protein of unknown function [Hymenobacter daecheongensis DSM 21074]